MSYKCTVKVFMNFSLFWCEEKREMCVFVSSFSAKNVHISLEMQQPTCNHNTINMRKKVNSVSSIKYHGKEPGLPMVVLSSWTRTKTTYLVLGYWYEEKRNTYVFILLIVRFFITCSYKHISYLSIYLEKNPWVSILVFILQPDGSNDRLRGKYEAETTYLLVFLALFLICLLIL